MEHTGEFFIPNKDISIEELEINLDRYLFVLPFIRGKTVMDLGSGCGLGTYFYSMFAKEVVMVDYKYNAQVFPFVSLTQMCLANLEKEEDVKRLPEVDVCVAMEVLEHVADPMMVLRNLKAKRLIFSVPLHSLEVSTWHKYDIQTVDDVYKLISPFYDIGKIEEQGHEKSQGKWVRGEGIRIMQ